MATEEKDVNKSKPAKRAGFDDKGKPYPGVSDKGERMAVTLAGLKAEFGSKRGEEMYRSIGQIASAVDPFGKLEEYAPDITIAGASNEIQFAVNEVLTSKE